MDFSVVSFFSDLRYLRKISKIYSVTDPDVPPYLVGGIATPLKNMKVNWDDYSKYMGK